MISPRYFIALLLALVLLSPLGIDLFLPTLPYIASGLQTPVSHIQLTIPLFLLVMGIGQLVSGPLVDNYGRKPIALFGLGLYLLGSALAALAINWPIFLTARIIQGMAVCCTAVVAFSGVRDRLEGDDAARAYSFLNGSLNIVPALAPLLGGVLAHYWGWRAPFGFLFLYGLLLMIIVYKWLPETRPDSTHRSAIFPARTYASIIKQPAFLAFTFSIASALGMVLTYVSLAPTVLMAQDALSPFSFSVIFGVNGLWIMAVSALANRIIPKCGRPFCLLLGALSMLIAGVILFSEPYLLAPAILAHWLSYMIPVAISVAGLAFIMGPATSYALSPFQHNAGVASALLGFIQMAGGAGGSLVVLLLPLSPYVALAIMMLLGGMLATIAWLTSLKIKGSLTSLN
ncbi:MFS transporter, DHA1 family, bicyclomycin/chloramphenicol resistance protein/MFS transporter, DHA1 family, florfenicol/chloramphenicol resistance protein [Rosenbergiella nectarea]|uniref:Bcr/CflA family efflux transporter n=1 Tax=Rosenbergiella nectarea TaxID=988801 RepID=A0A1H9I2F1_9GAMM|nr:Bcr/CflA family efflux MFS transporter [Rosenbergiella nectarea]SEQ68800.1 MFS transporter, DHA1 family, bicyclomycin/chloramphenicol resistance protein/MFS transporter, DHA1 family, florfenicol/chloramphenicol resistance protein [Rosenbergiella nectarea]